MGAQVAIYFALFHSACARKNFQFVGNKSVAGCGRRRGKSVWSRRLRLRADESRRHLFPMVCKLARKNRRTIGQSARSDGGDRRRGLADAGGVAGA
jgi:hypothetical protein